MTESTDNLSIKYMGVSKKFCKFFDSLKGSQKAFWIAFWTGGCKNRRRAAVDAGYSDPDHSSFKMYHSDKGKKLMAFYLDEVAMTCESIMAELNQMNQASIFDFHGLTKGQTLEHLHNEGVDTRQIKELKITRRLVGKGEDSYEVEDVQIKMYDRLKVLENQAKIRKMFQPTAAETVESFGELVHAINAGKKSIMTDPDEIERAAMANQEELDGA